MTKSSNKSKAPLIFVFVLITAIILGAIFLASQKNKTKNTETPSTTTTTVTETETSQNNTQTSLTSPNATNTASDTSTDTSVSVSTTSQTQTTSPQTTQPPTTQPPTTQVQTTTTTKAFVPSYLNDFSVSYDYFIGYDKTHDKILFEKNADEKCYPASVTKIVTAITAMENIPLDTPMTVGSEINRISPASSKADLKIGQVYTLKDLLYALILPSGNDAGCTIAANAGRYLYGEDLSINQAINRFMDLCNEKIKAIGAENTHFSCPYGSYRSNHYTTARDMLKISLYAMENPLFSEIVKTEKYKGKAISGESYKWSNTNYLVLKSNDFYYEYATGIKNGYSSTALYCLTASAEKDGRELYVAAFHVPTIGKRYNDVIRFFKTAYAQE